MDRYQDILKCLRQKWQQLMMLNLTDSQCKDALDLLTDQLKNLFVLTNSCQIPQRNNTVSKSTQNGIAFQSLDEWITISKAEEITGRNRGIFSRAASDKIIISNDRKGHARKVLKSSVLLFHQALRERKENKENSKEYYRIQRLENKISD